MRHGRARSGSTTLIDPDIRAFAAESDSFYPPDAGRLPLGEQRALYESYARAFAPGWADGVAVADALLPVEDRAIPLRRYRPGGAARGTIVYAHGGGFTLGSLASHDAVVARIAAATGATVVAIDYRLVPEHPVMAAVEDVMAVAEALAADRSPWDATPAGPLVLAGDSAGGTLAASAALRLRGRVALAGLALVYPMLGSEPAEPARTTEANAPMLTLAEVRACSAAVLAEPWCFPLDASSLAGLPPTLLLDAEHDPLRDDCAAFADRLRDAGVPVAHRRGEGLVHGSLRAIDRSVAAARGFAWLTDATARLLRGGAITSPQ